MPDGQVEEVTRARRPGRERRDVVVSLRFRQATIDVIDKHAERLELSRADTIRSLIRKGLEAADSR